MKRYCVAVAILLLATGCSKAASDQNDAPADLSFYGTSTPSATASPLGADQLPVLLWGTLDDARTAVGGLNLGLVLKVSNQVTMAYLPGTVLTQKPAAGTVMKSKQAVYVTVSAAPACDPSYPTICIRPFQKSLNCKDLTVRNFLVRPPDPYHLDPDKNGIGCPQAIKPPKSPRPSPSP
jgi:PASTA domain